MFIAFTRGNPSGVGITSELNSIYGNVATRYAYALVVNDSSSFSRNVKVLFYGDDSLIQIRPGCVFTVQHLIDGYKSIGMTYTDNGKKNVPTSKYISDLTFLRRSFVYDKESARWKCPLDHVVIENMINWRRDSTTETFAQVLSAALFEESVHGRKGYERFSSDLQFTLRELKLFKVLAVVQFHTYDTLLQMYSDRGVISGDDFLEHEKNYR
jgi:hypothetical protein